MAEDNSKPQITFELTGPRKGFTGMLGGRYGFRDGKLTVNTEHKDALKLTLCNRYGCNIVGEAPVWETKDGASVRVGFVEKPEVVVTTIVGEPTASVVVPPVKAPDAAPKVDPPQLSAGPDVVKVEAVKIEAKTADK